jgi:hypothetical protein
VIRLERGVIRFAPDREGRGDGVAGFDVAVRDRERLLAAARARGLAVASDAVTIGGARIGLC